MLSAAYGQLLRYHLLQMALNSDKNDSMRYHAIFSQSNPAYGEELEINEKQLLQLL